MSRRSPQVEKLLSVLVLCLVLLGTTAVLAAGKTSAQKPVPRHFVHHMTLSSQSPATGGAIRKDAVSDSCSGSCASSDTCLGDCNCSGSLSCCYAGCSICCSIVQ